MKVNKKEVLRLLAIERESIEDIVIGDNMGGISTGRKGGPTYFECFRQTAIDAKRTRLDNVHKYELICELCVDDHIELYLEDFEYLANIRSYRK